MIGRCLRQGFTILKAEVTWPRDVESSRVAAPGCQGFRFRGVDLLVLHAITHKVLGFVGFVFHGHMSRRTERAATPTASPDIIPGFHAASRGVDSEYPPDCTQQASTLLPQLHLCGQVGILHPRAQHGIQSAC